MTKKGNAKQKQRDKTRSAEDFERVKRTEVVSEDHMATNPLLDPAYAEELTCYLLPSVRDRVFRARDAKARADADRRRAEKKAREQRTLVKS